MPELPEVETVRRTLLPAVGAKIMAVTSSGKALRLGRPIPLDELSRLRGQHIVAIRRLGKYLLLDTSGPESAMVHLGMSGRFRLQPSSEPTPLHTHVIFALDGKRELRFSDPRRFGQVDVVIKGREREHASLGVLGPDPITEGVSGDHLFARSRGKALSLKLFILDQAVLAGVGNIYASEALWHAKLRPTKRAGSLTRASAALLATSIRAVLDHALDHGGTTLRDFVAADGKTGEHADYLQVYGRAEQPCLRCGSEIRRTVLGGRATYACLTCQR